MLKKTFNVNQLGDRLLEVLTDIQNHIEVTLTRYSNPKSFVNFLLPIERVRGWLGGVKSLRLLQGLL